MKTPFNMIILGMTGCGKTYYILNLLEEDYKNHFEYIFIICPTFADNKTYLNWKYIHDEDVFAIPCDQDDVDYYSRFVSQLASGTNSLIILDDCAASQDMKNRTIELVRLGFSARHYGLLTFVITQQLTSIAKPFRENIAKLVTFYNPSPKTLFHDYLELKKEDLDEIKKTLKNNDCAKLEILLRSPYTHTVVTPHTNINKEE